MDNNRVSPLPQLPPRLAASYPNPTQQLDFKSFSSDALRDYLRAERDLLRSITPDVPITTNFMVMGDAGAMDYPSWAADVDFVANDNFEMRGAEQPVFFNVPPLPLEKSCAGRGEC